ncbi:hypothetical protein JZ785_10070 [Alicyclobacillus curvatus]|nr:hypothetical protein JZ785_10070 [Alicyclobacillus curvatus]
MNIWELTTEQAQLVAAVGELEPSDAVALSAELAWSREKVSATVDLLMQSPEGRPGVVTATMLRHGMVSKETASDVRLSGNGKQILLGKVTTVCPVCQTDCGARLVTEQSTACGTKGTRFYVDAKGRAVALLVR